MKKIKDWVAVRDQPTVVKLDRLDQTSQLLFSSYYLTGDAEAHSRAILSALHRENGCGMFLVGHYGSGKSHFLAYLFELVRQDPSLSNQIDLAVISLLNFSSDQRLEDILEQQLGLTHTPDRRLTWQNFQNNSGRGFFLIFDELSEFLRSKPTAASFHEDIRFLQFLGEWGMDHPFWLLGALQEHIEHTGDMPYELYRKIKDRFPLRFFLSTTHVRDIISKKVLIKKEGYDHAIQQLILELKSAFPGMDFQADILAEIYPLHPATMQMLEEVRSLFSEARGMVDFVVHQLKGNAERHIPAFLENSWGKFLSPDLILAHFKDLLEMQGEFQKYARQIFPKVEQVLPDLFPQPALREIAEKIMAFLVLVHLSPNRNVLTLDEAIYWLLLKVTTVSPQKNREVVAKVLNRLSQDSDLVHQSEGGFRLHFGDGELESLEKWIVQAETRLPSSEEALLDLLLEQCPPPLEFISCEEHETWHCHYFKWHFHPREYQFCFGVPRKSPDKKNPALVILKPWEQLNSADSPYVDAGLFSLHPEPMSVSQEIRECAALHLIESRPMSQSMRNRFQKKMTARRNLFHHQMEAAYRNAQLRGPNGTLCPVPNESGYRDSGHALDRYGMAILTSVFPRFVTFAPSSGPLPKDLFRHLQRFLTTQPITSTEAPSEVRLIQEAYLIPMKLIRRKGFQLALPANLVRHELVERLLPILEHQPSVKKIYQFFGQPVYGLVPDQIGLLLIFLVHLGEIELSKAGKSYSDAFETLPNPIQYDRVKKVKQLNLEQTKQVLDLSQAFGIHTPAQFSSSLELKKAIQNLKAYGIEQEETLSSMLINLEDQPWAHSLRERMIRHLEIWRAFEKGQTEFEQIQHFLFQVARPEAFIQEHADLNALPAKLIEFQQKTARFMDLLTHPVVKSCPKEELKERLHGFSDPKKLENHNQLQEWLIQADSFYADYRTWYRSAHDFYWSQIKEPSLDGIDVPYLINLAGLPSVGLQESCGRFMEFSKKWRQYRCKGLSDMRYSPVCHCGFDGELASSSHHLTEAQRLLNLIYQSCCRFFQNEAIVEKVREWAQLGVDPQTTTDSFLVGKSPLPTIENLEAFREHLQGVNLVQDLPASVFSHQFGKRIWQREAFQHALQAWAKDLPNRFRIIGQTRENVPNQVDTLKMFAIDLALYSGIPLPLDVRSILEDDEHLLNQLDPKKIAEPILKDMHRMNLPEPVEDTLLFWCHSGKIQIPKKVHERSPVRLIHVWERWREDQTPCPQPDFLELAYLWAPRLQKVFGEPWLTFLDAMARWKWAGDNLSHILEKNEEKAWLVIDGLGLFCQRLVSQILEEKLPDYKVQHKGIGKSQPDSTTNGFYQELMTRETAKPFEKIDDIDQILHQKGKNLVDLLPLLKAQLEWKLTRFFDKQRPSRILIFADHGFRLAKNGLYFQHHGRSELERAFPYWLLEKK